MTLETIAHTYARCVELEERARLEAPTLADDLSVLRADLHAALMESLRAKGIPFLDRADAARIAFNIAHGKASLV